MPVAVVTGCNSGIGYAIAKVLIEEVNFLSSFSRVQASAYNWDNRVTKFMLAMLK